MKRLLVFAIVFGLTASYLNAQDDPSDGGEAVPPIELFVDPPEAEIDLSDWQDPAFNRMVDFQLLGNALAAGDAAGVTDAALQMVEAERILLRQHAQVDAATLLRTAMNIAQNSGDKATLDRLQKAAELTGNEQLAGQLKMAAALGGASRAVIPPPQIKMNTAPHLLAAAQALGDQVELAENARDAAALQDLRLDVAIAELPEDVKQWLHSLIEQAEKTVGEGAGPPAEALTKLAGASRGDFNLGSFFGALAESQSNLGGPSGLVPDRQGYQNPYQQQRRPASSQSMRNNGYRKYNDVNIGPQGQVWVGGQQRGTAQRRYNPQTGQHYYNYQTRNGGRIIQQSNGNTWVRPGQPQRRSSGAGKYLGTWGG